MKVTYDVSIEKGFGRAVSNPLIKEMIKFINSDYKNVCVEFETVKEARTNVASVRNYAKKHKVDLIIRASENKVYFIKN